MTQLEALTAPSINLSMGDGIAAKLKIAPPPNEQLQFSTVLQSSMTASEIASSDAAASPDAIRAEEVAKSFEAMLISQFVGEIFTEQKGGFFGEGFQGDFYSSLFSDAIAKQLSERGGFGFAKLV